MKGCSKREKKSTQIFKIHTKVKAGAHLGITLSAGAGGVSTES
jgi:hypothetical protein